MAIPDMRIGVEGAAPRDPFARAAYVDEVLLKRCLAFAIDGVLILLAFLAAWLVFGMIAVLSLGLLSLPLSVTVVAIVYFSLFTGLGRRATPGMAALGLELRAWDGGWPPLPQAVLRVILHWGSIWLLTPLVLVVALFDNKRRLAHDLLSGTIMVNRLTRAPDGV